MVENEWTVLPFPLNEVADPKPCLHPLMVLTVVDALLEQCAGQAGVLAVAVRDRECDQADVRAALQTLTEQLHACLALWRQWRAQERR